MAYGVEDIARNLVGLLSRADQLRDGEFWAVNDISFEVKRGETLGLIGPNGSGKSTLLKMLNGIFMPDRGRVEMRGRVGALIEVGAGFHPMLTGRENIYLNSSMLGMTKKEIDKKFDEIVDFADIGDFIDSPVKHYSTGMFVRLGFAVAIHTDPDILLIDEVLSVGDINYRMRCIDKIKEFQRKGKAIIFVSHDMSTVKKICQNSIWMHDGQTMKIGESGQTVDMFLDYMRRMNIDLDSQSIIRSDTLDIIDVCSEDIDKKRRHDFNFGESVFIRIKYNMHARINGLIFGIALFTGDNICISALHTGFDGIILDPQVGTNEILLEYPAINLLSGTYYFDIGFFEDKAIIPFAYSPRVLKIHVTSLFPGTEGLLIMEHKWQSH
jgi:ABC-type polysaccharide/polyol phosphate transport system ATPase subunit